MKVLLQRKTRRLEFLVLAVAVCLFLGKLLFGTYFGVFVVGSSSMAPVLPKQCLVFVERQPFESLEVGDIVAFKSSALAGKIALHRITRFTERGFFVKGDQNNFEDNQEVTEKDYIGKCVFYSYVAGVVVSELQKPIGFVVLLVLPIAFFCFVNSWVKRL